MFSSDPIGSVSLARSEYSSGSQRLATSLRRRIARSAHVQAMLICCKEWMVVSKSFFAFEFTAGSGKVMLNRWIMPAIRAGCTIDIVADLYKKELVTSKYITITSCL